MRRRTGDATVINLKEYIHDAHDEIKRLHCALMEISRWIDMADNCEDHPDAISHVMALVRGRAKGALEQK